MPPHLHLSVLGAPLLLTASGEPVRFRTRKHFAVLIRLAVEAGRRLTRDYLIELLWAEAPPGHARHSLAQAISVLRAKVGRDHVVIQKATLALAPGAVDVDLARLGGAADGVQVRGPFLDGFEIPGAVAFEHWKDEWRAKLMPRVRDALVGEMEAGRRLGDFAAVERHARTLYELDPLSEDAVRGLMEGRAWVGDRTNALKIFGRLTAQLAQDLGAKPSPDLTRMASLLREGRPSVTPPAVAGKVGERRERRFEAETLIGREREFAALYDSWTEVRRREPRVVVIKGDPGIGKTTLINAFASACQLEGAIVARAQAYDAERELPFAVLGELVRQLALQRAIGSADPEVLSELARVSPEIIKAFPGVPKPVDWTAEVMPLRLADAFLKAVTAAGEESSVILVVDDVHAADNASAAILHVVARKLERTRVVVILSGRPSELRASAACAALTEDTVIAGLRAIELDALATEAAAELVHRCAAGADPRHGDAPAERILRAGGGNPLALELLTREWAAHGPESLLRDLEALGTLPAPSLGIPRAIQAVFERQAGRLDPSTRAVLDLAAVLGRRLADLRLYAAVDCSPSGAGEALSRLRDQGLLREVRGDLEFRNELIRAQVYYAVAAPARQHLHRSVGEVLARDSLGEQQAPQLEIAWHFLRGCNVERALRHGLAGAEEALKTGAPYEAERVLSALRDHLGSPAQPGLLLLLATALLAQSKASEAAPILSSLASGLALAPRDTAELTRLQAIALYLVNSNSINEYCEVAQRALSAARETGDPTLVARALLECARSGAEAGDEAGIQTAESAIEVLLADPVAQGLHTAWYTRGYCHYVRYDIGPAATCVRKVINLLTGSPDYVALLQAHNALGACQYYACHFDSALESLTEALSLAKRMGDDFRYSSTASNLCSLHILEGNIDEAIRVGRLSVDVGLAIADQPTLMSSYTNLAEAYMLAGEQPQAHACLESARTWMEARRSWRANMDFICERANFALIDGNVALALQLIESAEAAARGREGVVPEGGMYYKLKIFKTEHMSGGEESLAIAKRAQDTFRGRHMVYYLEVLAATAWIEKRRLGHYTRETSEALTLFETTRARGLRDALRAQGFLSQPPTEKVGAT